MASFSMKVTGLGLIIKLFDDLFKNTPKRVERGMLKGGQKIMERSLAIVPVDTGTLKNSALPPIIWNKTSTSIEMRLGYGGYSVEKGYFLYVHEDLTMHHDFPTQAKFLEQPAREYMNEVKKIIRTEVLG